MQQIVISQVSLPESYHLRNLRAFRELAGWERPKLSELSGVAVPTLRALEDLRTEPSLAIAHRLAVALGVPLEMLFDARVNLGTVRVSVRRNKSK
jgi:transcriptional regulator with XRE-family HTH domain